MGMGTGQVVGEGEVRHSVSLHSTGPEGAPLTQIPGQPRGCGERKEPCQESDPRAWKATALAGANTGLVVSQAFGFRAAVRQRPLVKEDQTGPRNPGSWTTFLKTVACPSPPQASFLPGKAASCSDTALQAVLQPLLSHNLRRDEGQEPEEWDWPARSLVTRGCAGRVPRDQLGRRQGKGMGSRAIGTEGCHNKQDQLLPGTSLEQALG